MCTSPPVCSCRAQSTAPALSIPAVIHETIKAVYWGCFPCKGWWREGSWGLLPPPSCRSVSSHPATSAPTHTDQAEPFSCHSRLYVKGLQRGAGIKPILSPAAWIVSKSVRGNPTDVDLFTVLYAIPALPKGDRIPISVLGSSQIAGERDKCQQCTVTAFS